MSDSEMSALFPRLTNLEKPMFRPMAQSSTAVASAPDWEKKEMKPFGGVPRENDAFSEACVSISPRQLGPSTRTPEDVAASRRDRSRATPAPPISLNPAEMTIPARIPFAASRGIPSRMAPGATTKTPRSTGPGIASMDGYSGWPKSSPPPGFTP